MVALTKTEREILLHRLTVPDAICDYFADADEPKYTEEQVGDAITRLKGDVEQDGHLQDDYTDCEKDVLADLIDGSTWLGCAKRNVTEQVYGQKKAIGNKLAEKVSYHIGRKVLYPDG